jgi:hypothetical protein
MPTTTLADPGHEAMHFGSEESVYEYPNSLQIVAFGLEETAQQSLLVPISELAEGDQLPSMRALVVQIHVMHQWRLTNTVDKQMVIALTGLTHTP